MPNTILIVDDEKSIRNSLQRVFADLDFNILTAQDGHEALSLLQKNTVEVLLTDNCMPGGMDGIGLLEEVKKTSPNTIRLMMTAFADLQTALNAINRGEVYKFITKPWDNDELLDIVHEAFVHAQITDSLKKADEPTLMALAQTIELKDHYTKGHCDRVADYACSIASKLNFPQEQNRHIRHGSWLHDCGKIGVKESVLNSTGKLSDREWDTIQQHPIWGADVAKRAELHEVVINVIHYHHEKYDGSGYPAGLRENEIPIEARIVAVADVFDAITTDRSYKKKMSKKKAMQIMISLKGKHLDPELVDIFLNEQKKNTGQ